MWREVAIALLCAAALTGTARAEKLVYPPEVGRFQSSDGTVIDIRADQSFSLMTDAAGGRACRYFGKIDFLTVGHARANFILPNERPCQIAVRPSEAGVSVYASPSCAAICGLRADNEQEYRKVIAGCGDVDIAHLRERLEREFGRQDLAHARRTGSFLLETCGRLLTIGERIRTQLRLAVVNYRLDELAECRRMLQPLKDEFFSDFQAFDRWLWVKPQLPDYDEIKLSATAYLHLCGDTDS